MTLKEAREIIAKCREADKWDLKLAPKMFHAAMILDNRITELEAQWWGELFKAASEMYDVIESTCYDSVLAAPNNDDINRWLGVLQDAK